VGPTFSPPTSVLLLLLLLIVTPCASRVRLWLLRAAASFMLLMKVFSSRPVVKAVTC
jgi:hypothetical protein